MPESFIQIMEDSLNAPQNDESDDSYKGLIQIHPIKKTIRTCTAKIPATS